MFVIKKKIINGTQTYSYKKVSKDLLIRFFFFLGHTHTQIIFWPNKSLILVYFIDFHFLIKFLLIEKE